MKTKDYYDNNAQEFVNSTFMVDMQSLYQPFLNLLPDFGQILDLGCGSGRDALAFKNMGYQIEPTRVFRRQFILSHATLADSSNWR